MHFRTYGAAVLTAVPLVTSLVALSAADSTTPGFPLGDSGASARLIDVSLDVLAAAGASTATDDAISGLDAGHHDPARRGFTLEQAELSLAGAVDPYFTAEAHIVGSEEGFELEEAFATTTSLPGSLEARAGYFFTEFGRINPIHPHAWTFINQPVVASRFFGGDGTRAAGARVAWLTPLPWYSRVLVGSQNASDAHASSFRGQVDENDGTVTIAGRPRVVGGVHDLGDLLWLARWENAIDIGDVALRLGASFLSGPNASGLDAHTRVYGLDVVAKWHAPGGQHGYPFIQVEAEAMRRDYAAAGFDDGITTFAASDLRDRGGYLQAVYGFTPGWSAGLRGERASGSGESGAIARSDDPMRDDRTRVSPLLTWNPTHFSRLRLQYDYDRFDHDADGDHQAHSVWLGLEVLIGAHPAHGF